jgi:hypothetical protein
VALNPARVYDTRAGGTTIDGIGVAGGVFASGQARDIQLLGRGGVRAFGVDAVMVNITAVGASAPGFAKLYPTGDPVPNASSINFDRNTVANLAVVKVGVGGRISLLHDAYGQPGTAHYLLDVVGYFVGTGTNGIIRPPFPGRLDYQLGGPYTPAADVNIVSRDRTVIPTERADIYDICYVNGFQAQQTELAFWQNNHPGVLLRDGSGNLVLDTTFNEAVFDISTAAKRSELAAVQAGWITECKTRGYEAIEFDNLDTYLRFPAYFTEANTIDMANRLIGLAHTSGLAVAQKNAPELLPHRPAFDFAVVEQCSEFSECQAFFDAYGDYVLMIEYQAAAFNRACQQFPQRIVLYADVALSPMGAAGHRRQYCTG